MRGFNSYNCEEYYNLNFSSKDSIVMEDLITFGSINPIHENDCTLKEELIELKDEEKKEENIVKNDSYFSFLDNLFKNNIVSSNPIIEEKSKPMEINNLQGKQSDDIFCIQLCEYSEKRLMIKPGRKTKNSNRINCIHNKFSDDNLIRRIKATVINALFVYINKILKIIYNNSAGKEKELLKHNQYQVINSKADYNRDFLRKSLKNIFSVDISSKFKNYDTNHNKNIINGLLNEKDERKRLIFKKLFNLTFLDCIEHIRNTKFIIELQGLTPLEEMCKSFDDINYREKFKYYIFNLETIIGI